MPIKLFIQLHPHHMRYSKHFKSWYSHQLAQLSNSGVGFKLADWFKIYQVSIVNPCTAKLFNITIFKNTVQALKHPSADAMSQNVHKSDTTASNKFCQ